MPLSIRPAVPDFFGLAASLARVSAPILQIGEPYSQGDRVTERGHPDLVLTVRSCINGYVVAERWERHPDRKFESGYVLPGATVLAFGHNAPAGDFVLFARAGDNRPEPTPKPVRMSAVGRLEATYDGRISKEQYAAARAEDAQPDLGAELARSLMQAAE